MSSALVVDCDAGDLAAVDCGHNLPARAITQNLALFAENVILERLGGLRPDAALVPLVRGLALGFLAGLQLLLFTGPLLAVDSLTFSLNRLLLFTLSALSGFPAFSGPL